MDKKTKSYGNETAMIQANKGKAVAKEVEKAQKKREKEQQAKLDETGRKILKESGYKYSFRPDSVNGYTIPPELRKKFNDAGISPRWDVYGWTFEPYKAPKASTSISAVASSPAKVEPKKTETPKTKTNIQEQYDTVKDAADKARDYIDQNDLIAKAEEGREKYNMFAENIDTKYTDGLPKSIWKAWKSGKFGTPESKDAKNARNYLTMDAIGTALSNIGSSWGGGATEKNMWEGSVRKNMEEADKRQNEKFETNMMNEIEQLNVGAKNQQELNKRVNEVMADETLAIAAKHANNLEDTLGMWRLKQALGAEWDKMSKKEKQAFLNASNAAARGDVATAQAMMTTEFGEKEVANLQKKMLQYQNSIMAAQARQSNASAVITEKSGDWFEAEHGMGMVNGALGAIGSLVPGL